MVVTRDDDDDGASAGGWWICYESRTWTWPWSSWVLFEFGCVRYYLDAAMCTFVWFVLVLHISIQTFPLRFQYDPTQLINLIPRFRSPYSDTGSDSVFKWSRLIFVMACPKFKRPRRPSTFPLCDMQFLVFFSSPHFRKRPLCTKWWLCMFL